MDKLDILYRAYTDYKRQTESQKIDAERSAVILSNQDSDCITVQKNNCEIKEDWICAIEKGLVFIQKAIDQNRQFIRSNGEVVEIEKVKRVFVESIQHLSRHSELITKKHEKGKIIPDRLYTVERLIDYAVYENRFLFMTLTYLKSFIDYRYQKLLDFTTAYDADLSINKTVSKGGRKLSFALKMSETSLRDEFLKKHNPHAHMLERIDLSLRTVMHLLATPLMQEVAKVPILKPPITKTNVLKMDLSFKEVVALYEFLTAYEGDGFNVSAQSQRINPLPSDLSDPVILTSFLTYIHSLSLETQLKAEYEKEEEARRTAEINAQRKRILSLKERAERDGDFAEYVLELERLNRTLEVEIAKGSGIRAQLEKSQSEALELRQNIEQLNGEIVKKDDIIETIADTHTKELDALRTEHENRFSEAKKAHDERILDLNQSHDTAINELEDRLNSARNEFEIALAAQKDNISRIKAAFESECSRMETLRRKFSTELDELNTRIMISDCELMSLKKKYNLPLPDFTSPLSFGQLESQFNDFKAFFKGEWRKTKKSIRKEVLGRNKSNISDICDDNGDSTRASDDGDTPTDVIDVGIDDIDAGVCDGVHAVDKDN